MLDSVQNKENLQLTYHNLASTEFDRTLEVPSVVCLALWTPTMPLGIVPMHVDGALVAPHRSLPIPQRPSPIDLGKSIPSLRIFLRNQRFFRSDPSVQSSLIQPSPNGLDMNCGTSTILQLLDYFTDKEKFRLTLFISSKYDKKLNKCAK